MFLRNFFGMLSALASVFLVGCGGGGSGVQSTLPTSAVAVAEHLFVTNNDAAYAARVTAINLTTGASRKLSEIRGINSSCWSLAYDPVAAGVLVRCGQTTGTTGNLPYWRYDPLGDTVTNVSFAAVTPRIMNSNTSLVTVGKNIWAAEGFVNGSPGDNADITVLVNDLGVVSATKITLPTVNGYVARLQTSPDQKNVFVLTSNGTVYKIEVITQSLVKTIPTTGSAPNFLVVGGKIYVVNNQDVKVYEETTGAADATTPSISVTGVGPTTPALFAIGFNGTDLILGGNEGVWGYTLTSKVLAFYALDASATYREISMLANGDALLLENKSTTATTVLRSPKGTPRITSVVSSIPGTVRIQVLSY